MHRLRFAISAFAVVTTLMLSVASDSGICFAQQCNCLSSNDRPGLTTWDAQGVGHCTEGICWIITAGVQGERDLRKSGQRLMQRPPLKSKVVAPRAHI